MIQERRGGEKSEVRRFVRELKGGERERMENEYNKDRARKSEG